MQMRWLLDRMTAVRLWKYFAFRPALGSPVLRQLMPQRKVMRRKKNNLILGFHDQKCVCLHVENLRPPSVEIVRASSTLLKMPPLMYCIGHDITQPLFFEGSHGDGLRSCAHGIRARGGWKENVQRKDRQQVADSHLRQVLLPWLHKARQRQIGSTSAGKVIQGKSS